MTVAAACTVRTQYGSGGSSGNGSKTGLPLNYPPTPRRAPPPPLPLLGCSSGRTSPFSHLSRLRGKSSARQSRQGGRPEPGHGSLPVSSRPDMREKGRRKKGRTWAEAAKTVRGRERRGRPGGFRSLADLRRQGKGGHWPSDPAEGARSRAGRRRLVSGRDPCGNGGARRKRVAAALRCSLRRRRVLDVLGSSPRGHVALSPRLRSPPPRHGEVCCAGAGAGSPPVCGSGAPVGCRWEKARACAQPGKKRAAPALVESPRRGGLGARLGLPAPRGARVQREVTGRRFLFAVGAESAGGV